MVVAHTHWDREWYHPAVRFQARLVALVDALMDAPPDPATPFLLDGQAIVLADYLAIRPERSTDVARALASGAFEAGPWFVLADNLIPSGEAIVRNLEAGRRWLRRFGATAPRVAYCPDTFGHPAALPMIAAGFGCDVAVVWRGFGGATHPPVDTLWWEGPDTSRVLLYHLPPDGYEFGSALPVDPSSSERRWSSIRAVLRARNQTGTVVLTAGADHHAAPPDLPEAIEAIVTHAARDGVQVRRTTLGEAAGRLLLAARAHEARAPGLPTVRGELRDSYGYTWTLAGTLGTRAALKRSNARLERTLLRDVEPWLALAFLHADARFLEVANGTGDHAAMRHHGVTRGATMRDGAITMRQLPTLRCHVWELLLRTHPHDTLCGCSVDQVAHDMAARQRQVRALAIELRETALAGALRHDTILARTRSVVPAPPVVVRNRAARARPGIATITVLETLADVRVGPGSAIVDDQADLTTTAAPSSRRLAPATGAWSRDGKALDPSLACARAVSGLMVQPLAQRVRHVRRESPQHYPDNDLVREHRVLAWVPDVPAHGLRVFPGAGTPASHRSTDVHPVTVRTLHAWRSAGDDGTPHGGTRQHRTPGAVIELTNGLVRIVASRDGVSMEHHGRRLTNSLTITTVEDAGDSYTPSLRGAPSSLTLQSVRVGLQGPLRGSLVLTWAWREGRASVRVCTELSLDAMSPVVCCDVRGVNRRRNHRLRLHWQTDICAGMHRDAPGVRVLADAAFAVVGRTGVSPASTTDDRGDAAFDMERPPDSMPLHRWLSIADADGGATLLSDGLAEGSVHEGTLGVTLLRAIGELSRNDLPERPGHAGWPAAIPAAQSPGRFTARVGLLLHAPFDDAVCDMIDEAADTLLMPLVGGTFRDLEDGPEDVAGPALHGDGLRASTVSINDEGSALILRALNRRQANVDGSWSLPPGSWQVRAVRLDGQPIDAWTDVPVIGVGAAARGVVTVTVPAGACDTREIRRRPD